MPAALDLAGHRYGALTVIAPAGRVKFGRWQQAWRCRCECGVELTVPQERIPHCPSIAHSSRRAVTACPGCRARPCTECGSPILPPSTAATCSPACRTARKRRAWRRNYYDLVEANPDLNQRRHDAVRARAALDPDLARRLQAQQQQSTQRKLARARLDTNYREQLRALARATYARNAAVIQARRRARLDAMTPPQLDRWLVRARRYQRAYRKRWRAELARHPDRHQAYLDLMTEYRRAAALRHLIGVGVDLLERKDRTR